MTHQFYNKDDTYAEAFNTETGECMLRRAYDPALDGDLPLFIEYKKSWLLKQVASIRYEHETVGVSFAGKRVQTDRQSQAMLTGALVIAPDTPTQWKMADGTFVELTPRDIGSLVAAHVQECFANEARLSLEIRNSETVEALDALDLFAGWP